MPMLPGPDRPGGAKSPSGSKGGQTTTTGNVYTPSGNPKIAGSYKRRPKVDPKKYIIKKRGGNKGYVTILRPGYREPGSGGSSGGGSPSSPAPASQQASLVAGPYDRFKEIPGALAGFAQINADQAQHQGYVNDKVAPWLTQGLQGLAQFNTDAQNQYMGNVQGGAVGAAIAPNAVSGGPGGIVAGNNSFLTGAGQEFARASGSTAQQIAAYQGAMNKMQPTTLSQGYINSLADYAKGLPALYSERRRAFTEKLEGYLAEVQQAQAQAQAEAAQWQMEFDEKVRHNKVTEATSATNASTNAAFQASRLGLSAQDQAFDQQQDLTAQSTPAPAGYLRDPATGKLVRDPSVPQASASGGGSGPGGRRPTSTRDAKGRLLQPAEHGFTVGGWTKRPKGIKNKITQGADGKWYAQPASSSGGRAPTETQKKKAVGTPAFDVQKDLMYSIEKNFIDDTDQGTAVPQMVRFLRKHQPTNPKNFAKWWGETASILKEQNPDLAIWMANYMTRRQREGVWKDRF